MQQSVEVGSKKTKDQFREKLARVVDTAREGNKWGVPGFRFTDQKHELQQLHHPHHYERCIIAEAFRFVNCGKRLVIPVEDWKKFKVCYKQLYGISVALIQWPNVSYIGVAKCHPKDENDWEFGCTLALFRAAVRWLRGEID